MYHRIKNKEVDVDILPQVLGYAMWAETNPDSIKALWLECKNQPEDIQIDWDTIEIRCIIAAPSFNPNILPMAAKIGYAIDLVQVKRFTSDIESQLLARDDQISKNIIKAVAFENKDLGYLAEENLSEHLLHRYAFVPFII